MATPAELVARDDERRRRNLPIRPTAWIRWGSEQMAFWLPDGVTPEVIGVVPVARMDGGANGKRAVQG